MMDPPAIFAIALGDRSSWWLTAKALREASERLFGTLSDAERVPDPERPPAAWHDVSPVSGVKNVYVFLAGLALENLFKGELARLYPNSIQHGKLPKMFDGHDLAALASKAALPLSSDEGVLLETASKACISWGRYPGGKSHNKGHIAPPHDLDITRFKAVFETLFDRVESQVMAGIDGDGQSPDESPRS